MPVTPNTEALLNQWKANIEADLGRGLISLSRPKIQQLYELENLLFGATGGSIGAPIPNATLLLSAPQIGDDVEGEIDGIWHPALGQPILSEDSTARNGMPIDAQSVLFLTRLPMSILIQDTVEAWDLKNIAAYARLDGGRPEFDSDNGIRGFPLGGVYAKAWIGRTSALQAITESRWRPSVGQTPPYPNYRLITEVYFYREPIPAPVFEPSLTVTIGAGSGTTPTVPTATAVFGVDAGNEVFGVGDGNEVFGVE